MRQRVSDLLRNGGAVIYTSPETTVARAAQQMVEHNVGSILVLDRRRQLVGIFTERDLLHRVVVENRSADATRIGDVMTRDVYVVSADTPRGDVLRLMNQRHIRHVPVTENDRLIGVISLRDILRFEVQEKEFEIEQLKQYVHQQPSLGPPHG